MPVTVNEVTVIKPNLLRVEVLDGDVTRGTIEAYDASGESYNTFFTANSKWALPIGPNKDYVRYEDTEPDAYLDDAAAIVAANYGTIGGRTVSAVYYKSNVYDYYEQYPGTFTRGVQKRHYLYLELSADLAEGTHTIDFPAGTGIADYSFTYDTHTTRCAAIHVNQHGFRPGDSKIAYLSQWIPGYGTYGEIDIVDELSLTTFQVIDEDGNQVYTGGIAARVGPTDTEAGYNLPSDRQRIVDPNTTPIAVAAITEGATTVIEYSGADVLSNGDIISFTAVSGFSAGTGETLNQGFVEGWYKVANLNTTTNTFDLHTTGDVAVNTSTWTNTYTSGGLILKTHLSNTVGTHVYGMDFSAFQPANGGTYRIRIPGVGVSDEFVIDEAAWYQAAKIFARGEYHQRAGIALDGRFGYTRPVNLRSGQNSQTIYESSTPYTLCSEISGIVQLSYSVQQSAAGLSPFITTNEITGWGGWMDAGDWDTRLPNVAECVYLMLVVYDNLSSTQRTSLDFGLPNVSDHFGSTYSNLDGEGDLLHSALWCVLSYLNLQKNDGSVSAGFNIGISGGDGTPEFYEPSWLYHGQIYAYLPDEMSSYSFAGIAAKAASVLEGLGYTSIASTLETAAIDAWDWAESLYQNASGEQDAHYADVRADMKATYGISDANVDTAISEAMGATASWRLFAAACLFGLTGGTTYKSIIDAAWSWDLYGIRGPAAYEYSQATGADGTIAAAMETAITDRATTYIVGQNTADIGYKHLAFLGAGLSFGKHSGNWEDVCHNVIFADLISPSSTYKSVLQDGFGYILGANQTELSWVKGLGSRNTKGVLHYDAQSSGVDVPDGIAVYGPNRLGTGTFTLNFADTFLAYTKTEASEGTSPDENHIIKPNRLSWPINEAFWENPYAIEHTEFTAQQTILLQYSGANYLHALNDNTQTTYETYTGATGMLVTTSANAIVTNGSIEQATSIEAGVRVSWRGLTLDLDAATYTVTPVI